jgi:hypothetical protein
MKNLIKEICKREAGQSEVSVGNVREVLKHLADIIAGNKHNSEVLEFFKYINKKCEEKTGYKMSYQYNQYYVVRNGKNIKISPKNKDASKRGSKKG